MTNESQVRELVTNWAKAVKKGDIEGVFAYHSDDVVIFDVAPPLQVKGIDAYKSLWEPFFSYIRNGKFDLSEIKVIADEKVAFCHALLTVAEEEKPVVRLTIGLEKIDGEWLITHEHHSAPIED